MQVTVLVFVLGLAPALAQAQDNGGAPLVVLDGSAAPVAPETITRDAQGRATVRALKLGEPLRVDGRLDEEIYLTAKPFGGLHPGRRPITARRRPSAPRSG